MAKRISNVPFIGTVDVPPVSEESRKAAAERESALQMESRHEAQFKQFKLESMKSITAGWTLKKVDAKSPRQARRDERQRKANQ